MVLLATIGVTCGRSIVLFRDESGQAVIGDGESKGLSVEGSDVHETPRLLVGAALIQEVGVRAEGEGGNLSGGSGGWGGTPRLVVLRRSSRKGGRR